MILDRHLLYHMGENGGFLGGLIEGFCFPIFLLIIFQLVSIVFLIEDKTKLSSSSVLYETQTGVYFFIYLAIMGIFAAVFIFEPIATGFNSISNGGGYCLGAFLALCCYVTKISTIIPDAQPKTIEAIVLIFFGIIGKVYTIFLRQKSIDNQWDSGI